MSAAQPWMKFHPQDWRADEKLRMCSLAARGLWIEMLAIMHRSERYGHLLIAGNVPTDAQLAVQVGSPAEEITALLADLERADVFSRAASGAIYSRRMTRDHKKAKEARNNGKRGGNPKLCNHGENPASDKGQDKSADNGSLKLRSQKPDRNLSVSARGRAKPKVSLPEGWKPEPFGEGTQSRKIELAWLPDERARQIEAFRAHHLKNDSRFSDWQQAWSTWVLNSPGFSRTPRSAEPANYFEFVEGRA